MREHARRERRWRARPQLTEHAARPAALQAQPPELSSCGGVPRVITLVDVLEHVPDTAALLASARARLRPNGRVLAALPNAASATRRLLGRRWPHYVPEHLFHWTPGSLRRFLASRGWLGVEIRTGIRKAFTARYLVAYQRQQGRWIPPGLRLLGDRILRVPTGEMPLLASRPAEDAAPG